MTAFFLLVIYWHAIRRIASRVGGKQRAMRRTTGGLKAWIRDRCVLGETLVCPLRVLWNDYRAYCALHGFDQADVTRFVRFLGSDERVRLVDRGRGRLHRAAEGIGLRPHERRETGG